MYEWIVYLWIFINIFDTYDMWKILFIGESLWYDDSYEDTEMYRRWNILNEYFIIIYTFKCEDFYINIIWLFKLMLKII